MNKSGKAFPSEQTIAILTGCTEKSVREGLKGLLQMPDIKINSQITPRGHRQKVYLFSPPQDNASVFYFYKNVIEGGNWRELRTQHNSRSAHGVYCTLFAFAYFDIELYLDVMGYEFDGNGFDVSEFYHGDGMPIESNDGKNLYIRYQTRTCDFVEADIDVIAEYTGIGVGTAQKAMAALEAVDLIKPLSSKIWQIFRTPPRFYKRSYLNDKTQNQFEKTTY